MAPATYKLLDGEDEPDTPPDAPGEPPGEPPSSPDDPQADPGEMPVENDAATIRAALDTNTENAALNDWGCDKVFGLSALRSEGNWGACCDTHDSCYEQYNCTANSWSPFSTEGPQCGQCNTDVVKCALSPQGPGPSVCVTSVEHPCGSYRSGPH